MRAWAVPVAVILIAGALAGCVNTPKDVPGGTTGSSTRPTSQTGVGTGLPGTIPSALPPLALAVSGPSGKWVAPGSTVSLAATTMQSGWALVWAQGALPGTVAAPSVKLDTGSAKDASDWILPGETKSLTFSTPGVFQMHCHPHPYMLSNVTVVDGHTGPKDVHVAIVDGTDLGSYRYAPANIVVAPDTKVWYHNNGTQPHTATLSSAEPALKKLPLTAASGEVVLEGEGWQRIVLFAMDATGRLGKAELHVYVAPLPTYAPEPYAMEFNAGGLPEEAQASQTKSFTLDANATLNVTWAFKDAIAANGGPVNNAEVDIHVFPQGSEQDVITSETKPEGNQAAKVPAGTYTVKVVAKKGVAVKGTVTVQAAYEDPTPPAPMMIGAGGGDGHGHQH